MDSVMISTNVRSTEEHVPTDARTSMADSLVDAKMDHSKLETGESSQSLILKSNPWLRLNQIEL